MINLAPNKQIKIHRKFNRTFPLLDLKKKKDPSKLILQSLQRDKNSYNILPIITNFPRILRILKDWQSKQGLLPRA